MEIVGIESIGERVLPTVFVQWTVLYRSDGVLPLIACGEVDTFHDAAAREAQQPGLLVGKSLGKITAHAVLAVFEGVDREE